MGIIKSKKEPTITEGDSGRYHAGRTSAWWDNFINSTMIEEEWRENFRMSKTSLLKLAEKLRPYNKGKETIMRSPVDVVRKNCLNSILLQASTVYTSQ